MRRLGWMLLVVCAACLMAGSWATASDPGDAVSLASSETVTIRYQGTLDGADDLPVTGSLSMQFRLYNSRTGGTELWASGPLQVEVDAGLFSVSLPVTRGVFDGRRVWLATYVDDEVLSPRQEVAAVPYAAGLIPGVCTVGDESEAILSVANTGGGDAMDVSAARGTALEVRSGGPCGLYVAQSGAGGQAGYFESESGSGVCGISNLAESASDDDGVGVRGHSAGGHGVYGASEASDRAGVLGTSADGAGVRGDSLTGVALEGVAESGTGLLVQSHAGTGGCSHQYRGSCARCVVSGD